MCGSLENLCHVLDDGDEALLRFPSPASTTALKALLSALPPLGSSSGARGDGGRALDPGLIQDGQHSHSTTSSESRLCPVMTKELEGNSNS
jgi:hypothetical protein